MLVIICTKLLDMVQYASIMREVVGPWVLPPLPIDQAREFIIRSMVRVHTSPTDMMYLQGRDVKKAVPILTYTRKEPQIVLSSEDERTIGAVEKVDALEIVSDLLHAHGADLANGVVVWDEHVDGKSGSVFTEYSTTSDLTFLRSEQFVEDQEEPLKTVWYVERPLTPSEAEHLAANPPQMD